MYWLCSKQNWLLCAHEHDFGDNYIILIVKTGLTKNKYVIVLSVLNLVSDFVKCNHPIHVSCQIMLFMSNHVIHVKSCNSCQIMPRFMFIGYQMITEGIYIYKVVALIVEMLGHA
jgi:hypothetical protein